MANSTVQTLPLANRLNANQREKRTRKIQARAQVADALAREIGLTRMFIQQQGLAFTQALRWLVLAIIAIGLAGAYTLYRTF